MTNDAPDSLLMNAVKATVLRAEKEARAHFLRLLCSCMAGALLTLGAFVFWASLRMLLLLDPTPFARGLVRKKVDVVNYPDGRFAIQFEGTSLPFRIFDKIQTVQPGEVVVNKRLGLNRNRLLVGRCEPTLEAKLGDLAKKVRCLLRG